MKTTRMKSMSRTAGYRSLEHRRNGDISEKLSMDPVGKKLAQSKQIWSDHVRRTNYVTPRNSFLVISPLEDEDLDNF
jgi:hypothetical protein